MVSPPETRGMAAASAFGSAPWLWVVLSILCAAIDYAAGPNIQFPFVYLLPISLAAWHGGRRWGFGLAIILTIMRFYFTTIWQTQPVAASLINAVIRILVFGLLVYLIDRTAREMRYLRRTQILEGLLGVCAGCGRIHNDEQSKWEMIEAFVSNFPHKVRTDLCPDCEQVSRDVMDRR